MTDPSDRRDPTLDDSDLSDAGTDGESTGTLDEDRVSEDLPADEDAVPAPDEPLR